VQLLPVEVNFRQLRNDRAQARRGGWLLRLDAWWQAAPCLFQRSARQGERRGSPSVELMAPSDPTRSVAADEAASRQKPTLAPYPKADAWRIGAASA